MYIVSLLVNRKIHHWRSDHLTGCIWNLLTWHLKTSVCLESPHFGPLSLLFVCLAWIKNFLKGWSFILMFTWVPLLWSRLVGMLFPLALAWWEVCSLMPHEINLSHLGITCNLFDVPSGRLGIPSSWQAASPCMLETWINLYLNHWWSSRQTLHLLRNTRRHLCARYLQFLVGIWKETLELEQHCTTYQLTNCLAWSLSAGQIWL